MESIIDEDEICECGRFVKGRGITLKYYYFAKCMNFLQMQLQKKQTLAFKGVPHQNEKLYSIATKAVNTLTSILNCLFASIVPNWGKVIFCHSVVLCFLASCYVNTTHFLSKQHKISFHRSAKSGKQLPSITTCRLRSFCFFIMLGLATLTC